MNTKGSNTKNLSQTLNVSGYVESIRHMSTKLIFLKLRTQNDPKEGVRKIQLVVKESDDLLDKVKNIPRESFITVLSDQKQQSEKESWILKEITAINPSFEVPPVDLSQKQVISEEIALRAIKNRSFEDQKNILVRASLYECIRQYLKSLNFLEYDSPKITNSFSESGADLFEISNCADGKKRYLTQSPQLYKQRLINAGFKSVYEIAHIFRNEKFNTSRHMCETTCLDVEMNTETVDVLINLITNLLIHISQQMHKRFGLECYTLKDFSVITYAEALKLVNSEIMDRETEKKLFSYVNTKFIYVINYPNSERPFYTSDATGFDLLHFKCELISGSLRITKFSELEAQARLKGIKLEEMPTYYNSFKLGCAPSGGFALGLDRLLMVLLDKNCVQDTLFF